ncbi:hypothetical protein KQI84_03665 [bacterium]|nr:hypothetical protein [bacterium]
MFPSARPSIWSKSWLWVILLVAVPMPFIFAWLLIPRPDLRYQEALAEWAEENTDYDPNYHFDHPPDRAQLGYDTLYSSAPLGFFDLLKVANAPLIREQLQKFPLVDAGENYYSTVLATMNALQIFDQGDWDSGIALSKESACAKRKDSLSWRRFAARNRSIDVFEEMLRQTPDVEKCREMAVALTDVRNCAPVFDERDLVSDIVFSSELGRMRYFRWDSPMPRVLSQRDDDLTEALRLLVRSDSARARISNRADMRWIDSLGQRYSLTEHSWDYTKSAERMPWTREIALKERLATVSARNPGLMESLWLPEEVTSRFTVEERASTEIRALLVAARHVGYSRILWRIESRALATQIAWAARVYRFENGEWPESIAQLDPDLLQPTPDWEAMKHPNPLRSTGAVGEYRLQFEETTPELALRIPGIIDGSEMAGLDRHGTLEWEGNRLTFTMRFYEHRSGFLRPDSILARNVAYIAESMADHPLVESVHLSISSEADGPLTEVTPAEWLAAVSAMRNEPMPENATIPEIPFKHGVFTWTAEFPDRLLTVRCDLPEREFDPGFRRGNEDDRDHLVIIAGWEKYVWRTALSTANRRLVAPILRWSRPVLGFSSGDH